MKKMVISLGGSLIIPDKINYQFLEKFKKVLRKHYKTHKFVVVCGGGSIARKYIQALKAENKGKKELSQAGMRATRMNALFITQFFGKEANSALPKDMKEVSRMLEKNNVVFCGALRYASQETSDGTAAKLAHFFKTDFINLTNVPGLFTSNPLTSKNAKFIPRESWKKFESRALKMKFKAGQHFVLDQEAAILIKKHKIKTYILGPNLSNLDKVLRGKPFIGTLISG